MLPSNEPSIIIKPIPKIINNIQNHCVGWKNSSFVRYVIRAIPKGNKYKIISTNAMSKNSIAWYVTAIKLTDTKLIKIKLKKIFITKGKPYNWFTVSIAPEVDNFLAILNN